MAAPQDQQLDALLDFFLSPQFDPFVRNDEDEDDHGHFAFEGEAEVADGIHGPEAAEGDTLDHAFLKQCGQKLSKMGDEYLNHKLHGDPNSDFDPALTKAFLRAKDGEVQENEAWKSFERYMDQCIPNSETKDAYMMLGAVLMVAKGLSTLGSHVPHMAHRFARTYITKRRLDADIERMGGLNGLVRHELD